MKKLLAIALLLAAGQAAAHDREGVHVGCNAGSDWSVSSYRSAFLFTRDASPGREVGIGGGRLFVDGREVTLGSEDQRRIAGLESELRELAPELHDIGREAVDIAFTALVEVARGLSSTPNETIADLQQSRRRALADIDRDPLALFNGDAMAGIIEPIVEKFVPDIVGGAVGSALKAAFSGDAKRQEFQARMDRMEHEIDTRVDARAKALEPLADRMCQRLVRMDALDDALEVRLSDGKPLQLLRIDPDHGKHRP